MPRITVVRIRSAADESIDALRREHGDDAADMLAGVLHGALGAALAGITVTDAQGST